MNPNVEYKTRNVQKILNFLNKGHKSQEDYVGSDMPFFMKNESTEFQIGHHVIPELPNGLNHDVVNMYKIIGIVNNHYIVKTHKGLKKVKILGDDKKNINDEIKITKL